MASAECFRFWNVERKKNIYLDCVKLRFLFQLRIRLRLSKTLFSFAARRQVDVIVAAILSSHYENCSGQVFFPVARSSDSGAIAVLILS